MQIINNPSKEQIKKADELLIKQSYNIGRKYALSTDGKVYVSGEMNCRSNVQAQRYIRVYNNELATEEYILLDVPMYHIEEIYKRGLVPLSPSEIPNYFENLSVIIAYC